MLAWRTPETLLDAGRLSEFFAEPKNSLGRMQRPPDSAVAAVEVALRKGVWLLPALLCDLEQGPGINVANGGVLAVEPPGDRVQRLTLRSTIRVQVLPRPVESATHRGHCAMWIASSPSSGTLRSDWRQREETQLH